jgi:hypothetical protein
MAAYSVVEVSLQLKNLNRMADNQPLEVSVVIPCLNEAKMPIGFIKAGQMGTKAGPKPRPDHGR